MQFESKTIVIETNKTTNIPFMFKGIATKEINNIKVHPACGCTKSTTLKVERNGSWVSTTLLKAGEAFRVTGALNKLNSSGVSTKVVFVSGNNIEKIQLKFTMKLV